MLSRAPVLAVVTAVAVVQALTDRTRVVGRAGGVAVAAPPAPDRSGPPRALPSPRVPDAADDGTTRTTSGAAAGAAGAADAARAVVAARAAGATAARRGRPRSAATLAGLVGLPALALALPAGLPLTDSSGPATTSVASGSLAGGSVTRAPDEGVIAPSTGGPAGTASPAAPAPRRAQAPESAVPGTGPAVATLAAERERVLAERAVAAEAEALRAARSASARGAAARRAAAAAAAVAEAARPRATAPVAAPVGSAFGYRWGRLHAGLDFPAPLGTPISAAADGVVEKAGPASGYGNLVTVRHGDGTITAYGHMRVIAVAPGQTVQAGEVIAQVGNEGRSTGPHLHFEVRTPEGPLDPRPWLAERGVQV